MQLTLAAPKRAVYVAMPRRAPLRRHQEGDLEGGGEPNGQPGIGQPAGADQCGQPCGADLAGAAQALSLKDVTFLYPARCYSCGHEILSTKCYGCAGYDTIVPFDTLPGSRESASAARYGSRSSEAAAQPSFVENPPCEGLTCERYSSPPTSDVDSDIENFASCAASVTSRDGISMIGSSRGLVD